MNMIELFQKGNQELFHSSFIAWLLDKNGEHGLGSRFANKLFERIEYEVGDEYTVKTESSECRCRYDILIEPQKGGASLVLENKYKSFGNEAQIALYENQGHKVAFLAFLEETIKDANNRKFNIIRYEDILKYLDSENLIEGNHYHFIIREYKQFIKNQLRIYNNIKDFCFEKITWEELKKVFTECLKDIQIRDNDVRTYNYFFYYNFEIYLRDKISDLIFGDLDYDEAEKQKENTKWCFEKNLSGIPFMEALIYNPNRLGMNFRLNSDLLDLYNKKSFTVAPRIEIWLDPLWLLDKPEDFYVGKIMIGAWSDDLKIYLRQNHPYKSECKKRGSRNFHYEEISIKDLVFMRLANRIMEMMKKIGFFVK